MLSSDDSTVTLMFALEVEDDWPPVGLECLPFQPESRGLRLLAAPLFVCDLSVGDVIEATLAPDSEHVERWRHVARSDHSTFWLLGRPDEVALRDGLAQLRSLGCSTASGKQLGAHSVDVPGEVSIEVVDSVLDGLEQAGVPVACPSFRHPERHNGARQ